MSKLTIAAISDLHGYLPEMEEPADILLLAGDISPLEIQRDLVKMDKWVDTKFIKWIEQLPVKTVYFTPGNHDFYFERLDYSKLFNIIENCEHKLVYLDNKQDMFFKDNEEWTIFGTPYCHMFGRWPFMKDNNELTTLFKEIPETVDIIITHDPPFNLGNSDLILGPAPFETSKSHVGSIPLGSRLSNVNYKLCVCGHIHTGDHNYNKEHNIVNVSYVDEYYSPKFPYFYKILEK